MPTNKYPSNMVSANNRQISRGMNSQGVLQINYLTSQPIITPTILVDNSNSENTNSAVNAPKYINLGLAKQQTQQSTQSTQPHTYLYVGSVILVLGFIFLYMFLCKYRKDNKNKKKPIKNELVQQKTPMDNQSGRQQLKGGQVVELVQLP